GEIAMKNYDSYLSAKDDLLEPFHTPSFIVTFEDFESSAEGAVFRQQLAERAMKMRLITPRIEFVEQEMKVSDPIFWGKPTAKVIATGKRQLFEGFPLRKFDRAGS